MNAEQVGEHLSLLRTRRPLIHHLANQVTMRDVADATLAIGALPIMALAGDEVEEILGSAQALALNLGTPTPERVEVSLKAGRAANARGVPVILDPVGAGASMFRTGAARRILADVRVRIIRSNPGEAAALLGVEGTMRGVESSGGAALSSGALVRELARRYGAAAAVTGARDHVGDGRRIMLIDNGDPMLARIAGGGDLATALIAAFAAVVADAVPAAVSGLVALGVAAEVAAAHAGGPGSFKTALVDALAALTPPLLVERARILEAKQAWT